MSSTGEVALIKEMMSQMSAAQEQLSKAQADLTDALRATGATIAFDAIGGGDLASTLLSRKSATSLAACLTLGPAAP